MAFNALKQCRPSMQSPFYTRSLASSTSPKFAASVATAGAIHQQPSKGGRFKNMSAKFGSVWAVIGIMGGMVAVAGSIGVHTAVQRLFRSPSVQVTKKRRECVPEVDDPGDAIRFGHKFVDKSFLSKVAHIGQQALPQHTPSSIHSLSRS